MSIIIEEVTRFRHAGCHIHHETEAEAKECDERMRKDLAAQLKVEKKKKAHQTKHHIRPAACCLHCQFWRRSHCSKAPVVSLNGRRRHVIRVDEWDVCDLFQMKLKIQNPE